MSYFKLDTMQFGFIETSSLTKVTSSVLVFLLLGFLSSFCWAMPTSAAVSLDPYQQQIDKLGYPTEDYCRSTVPLDAFKPATESRDKVERQTSNSQKQKVPLEEKRDRLRSSGIQSPISVPPSTIAPITPPELVQDELVQPAPIQEVLEPDTVPQRTRQLPITPKTAPRLDPYSLIAAKRRHSHSIGHSTAFRERGMSSIAVQQPERFRTMIGNGRARLQQLTSQQLELRRHDLQIFIEDDVKGPLRHVFKKIELFFHKAAKRLS